MGPSLLDVRDLATWFLTDEGVVRAVDGVSFAMAQGERLGVVGESGSGKSVTALSIVRLIDPPAGRIVSGDVLFEGEDLLALSERDMERVRGPGIATIFQDPMTALDPVFTLGAQLVETIQRHTSTGRAQARATAIDALREVGIPRPEQRLGDYPHQFSGGMRQRVVIAMALVLRPRLLIADEPTTALDVTTQAQVLELIDRLARDRGTAVMLITHDLGVVAGFCDRVQEMYAGRIVERAAADALYEKPLHPYTWALLGSIPRLDEDRPSRLRAIPGAPPSLISPPSGCPFHPRCPYAQQVCHDILPPLRAIETAHEAACHFAGELDFSRTRAAS
jgi:oligopeptide transport system ATP-binding protein